MGDTMREGFDVAEAAYRLNFAHAKAVDKVGCLRGGLAAAYELGRQLGMEQAHALHELSKSSREIEAMPVFWAASWVLDDLDNSNDVPIRIWRNPADKTGLSPFYTAPAGDSDTKEN